MNILLDSIKESIARYCSYQERSQKDVEQKLIQLKCMSDEIPHYIVWLIEENFLNEERFAQAYVRGKFRMKKWGKQKIIRGLKNHSISTYLQHSAMSEISDDEYRSTADTLVQKKMKALSIERLDYLSEQKVYAYMYRKGYESDLIKSVIAQYK